MKVLRLFTFASLFSCAYALGCGGGGGNGGTGGTIVVGSGGAAGGLAGQGGALRYDATAGDDVAVPTEAGSDAALSGPETSTGLDATRGEAGSAAALVDCIGLTPAQCHDKLINPAVVPDSVLVQEPGPAPGIPYPSCTSL